MRRRYTTDLVAVATMTGRLLAAMVTGPDLPLLHHRGAPVIEAALESEGDPPSLPLGITLALRTQGRMGNSARVKKGLTRGKVRRKAVQLRMAPMMRQ